MKCFACGSYEEGKHSDCCPNAPRCGNPECVDIRAEMRQLKGDGKGITITLNANEKNGLTVHDSSTGLTESWDGVILILGDEDKGKYSHWTWGRGRSVVFGFYASIMQSRDDPSEMGKHHRAVFGAISRMILELYDYFRKAKHLTPEEALRKWEIEDAEKENDKFH